MFDRFADDFHSRPRAQFALIASLIGVR